MERVNENQGINGKAWAVCGNCGKIIRFDKPLLGSLHICTLPEEREQFAKDIAIRTRSAEKLLSES